jgi:hypothetical protein
LSQQYPPKIRLRIESLSDLVFGLALSIGSLTLIGRIPTTQAELVGDIAQFAFSFLILIAMWTGYTRIIMIFPIESSLSFTLNIALLFCVSIEPFLFYVLRASLSFIAFSTAVYGLDIGGMYLLLATLTVVLLNETQREGRNIDSGLMNNFRWRLLGYALGGMIFLVSSLPYFWVNLPVIGTLRMDMWVVAFVLFFFSRSVLGRTSGRNRKLAH